MLGAVAVGDHPSDSGTDSRDREGTDQHIFLLISSRFLAGGSIERCVWLCVCQRVYASVCVLGSDRYITNTVGVPF